MNKLKKLLSVLAGIVAGIRRKEDTVLLANAANANNQKTHANGLITRLSDAAISTRNLLVMVGSDQDHFKVPTATTDVILGVCLDSPEAAEENCTIQLLGCAGRTVLMVAGAAISAGALVCCNGTDGKVKTAVATNYVVGRALYAAGADGDVIEVEPMLGDRVAT
jgi:hypothetical protein